MAQRITGTNTPPTIPIISALLFSKRKQLSIDFEEINKYTGLAFHAILRDDLKKTGIPCRSELTLTAWAMA